MFGGRSAAKAGAAFMARAAGEGGAAPDNDVPAADPPVVLPEPLVAAVRVLEDAIRRSA